MISTILRKQNGSRFIKMESNPIILLSGFKPKSVSCLAIFPNIIQSPIIRYPLLFSVNGADARAPLPKNIAPGNYLVRHEIIALHLATTKGKAEFYPSCSQIKVDGNQTGAPNANELVTFPGGYSDDDPGIFDTNVFDPTATYIFPGPPIASFVNGASSNGGSSTGPTTTTPSASSAPPVQSSQSSGQSCQVTLPSTTPYSNIVHPHHFSRIMQRLFVLGGIRH